MSDALRDLAYHIWEEEGRPHGREHDHWAEAERRSAAAPPKKVARPKVAIEVNKTVAAVTAKAVEAIPVPQKKAARKKSLTSANTATHAP